VSPSPSRDIGMKEPGTEPGSRSRAEAKRRKRKALASLKADPRFRRVRPDERVPEGTVEITIGGWIPGSRRK
jgi:hypothetical protein